MKRIYSGTNRPYCEVPCFNSRESCSNNQMFGLWSSHANGKVMFKLFKLTKVFHTCKRCIDNTRACWYCRPFALKIEKLLVWGKLRGREEFKLMCAGVRWFTLHVKDFVFVRSSYYVDDVIWCNFKRNNLLYSKNLIGQYFSTVHKLM